MITYSHGYTYQNRNNVMANSLLNFSIKHQTIIFQKYLESEHIFMECYSVFDYETKIEKS